MPIRLMFCIAMGVFVAHIGIFMIFTHLGGGPKYTPPHPPNFTSESTTVVDSATGEKTIYREITVSTKFAPSPATPPPEKLHLDTAAVK